MRPPFHAHRHTLRPGSRDAVRAWQQTMDRRHAEVLETLRAEGVELELVLFEPGTSDDEPDSLIFVLRTVDFANAVEVFRRSTLEIDRVHREFLERVSLGSKALQVVGCHELPERGTGGVDAELHS